MPIPYNPGYMIPLLGLPNPGSAWRGLDGILPALINDFNIGTSECLEVGVEGGYSTAALAHYFESVTGVDHFKGDEHSGIKEDAERLQQETRAALSKWPNIRIVNADCFDWMLGTEPLAHYDLVHLDLVHTYEATYCAALWACDRADLVILHDTHSFPDVMRACQDAADAKRRVLYDFPDHHGLGILAKGMGS